MKTSNPKHYKKELKLLQIELTKLQRHIIKNSLKILIIFEGRDAAGKDGVIKRIAQHLSPRETRIVALGKPSDHDRHSWYFQRYVPHLPAAQEMVLFNRSWYNRAGVEHVMKFCTEDEYQNFLENVLVFESLLVKSGIQLFKYYLDISKNEQASRLESRQQDPLKQWKTSPIDEVALSYWENYSAARNIMLTKTHNQVAPWVIVHADNKKKTRLNVIRHIMLHVQYPEKHKHSTIPDINVVHKFSKGGLRLLSS